MSVVNEIRSRSTQPGKSGGSATTIIIGIVAMLAAGAAAAMYFAKSGPAGPTIAIEFTSGRLGKETAAPLFRDCIASKQMPRFTAPNAGAMEAVATQYMRDKAVELSECAYEQNIGAFCDPNNRAFAVQTALQMLRHTDPMVEQQKTSRNASHQLVVRDRVIASVAKRARQGELIARDFGMYPHAALNDILALGAASNICAK